MAKILVNALSLRPGGGLQVIKGLLSKFSDKNTYHVICSDPRSRKVFDELAAERTHVHVEMPLGEVSNAMLFLWQMTKFKGYVLDQKFDLVMSVNFHYPCGDVPQIVYHLSMLRFEREKGSVFSLGEIQEKLRDWRSSAAIRYASANIFESFYLQGLAESAYGKISGPNCIYIGLDDRQIEKIKLTEPPVSNHSVLPDLLAMTSSQPHKDNPTLVRMMACLDETLPEVDWRLRVAGGRAGAFDDLMELSHQLKVADRIEWMGFTSHKELEKLAQNSLCLVTPSLKESFCMVALEAMSWGCPAIVANCTSMPESVSDAGLLAEPGNASDFASQVIALYQQPSFRADIIKRGFEHASRHSWSSAALEFEAIFNT